MANKYYIEDHHLNSPIKQGSKIIAFCPFHPDKKTPNLTISEDRTMFKCFRCGEGGSAYDFLKRTDNLPEKKATTKPGRPPAKPTENDVILNHGRLLESSKMMAYLLEKRGWKKETILKHKLGLTPYDSITIPIRDFDSNLINIRVYNILKTEGSPKFRGWAKGYGKKVDFFPATTIKDGIIYLFESTPDCILAGQLGFNAGTFTGGVENVKFEHLNVLEGKDIIFVGDIDDAGRKFASKVTRCLAKICTSVKNIYLPITEPANGDFTDFILGHSGGTSGALAEFKHLVHKTPRIEVPVAERAKIAKMEPKLMLLEEACLAKNVGFKQQVQAMVAGKDMEPYLVPRKVLITCTSPESDATRCKICGLNDKDNIEITLSAYDPEILEVVGQSQDKVRGMFRRLADVHTRCTSWDIDILSSQNVENLILIPEIDYDSDLGRPYVSRTAYIVNKSIEANKAFNFVGWTAPDPNTHHVVHIMEKAEPTASDIDTFELSTEMKIKLAVFQAITFEDMKEKLNDIYADYEDHVTHIWGRRDILLLAELAYHSAIHFVFEGRRLRRGWVEVLIIGDTRTGKSETIETLRNHFHAGEMISAENLSFAGLVGGVNIIGSRKYITWGKLPLNDGRLVIIDEFSGMEQDQIERLSGVRSSGVAEITKIQTERTMARCRLIIISNPRRLTIGAFSPGVVAIKDLIGKVEDIARFDIAITCASNEVKPEEINKRRKPRGPHVFTKELCSNRLRWVWSRGDKIKFTDEAIDLILDLANDMAKKYHPAIPLVEPSEVRIKIARLSVSVAGMFCSTEDWEHVIVTHEHVKVAHTALINAFNKPSMRYNEFSEHRFKDATLEEPYNIKLRLKKLGLGTITDMLDRGNIQLQDLEDWVGDRKEAKSLSSYLVQSRCMKKPYSYYVKTPAFNDLLREIKKDIIESPDDEEPPPKGQDELPF